MATRERAMFERAACCARLRARLCAWLYAWLYAPLYASLCAGFCASRHAALHVSRHASLRAAVTLLCAAPGMMLGATLPAAFPAGSTVAVFPLADFTSSPETAEMVLPALRAELVARGATVLMPSDLRPLLREHRIRSPRGLSADDAQIIRLATGADYALLGAYQLRRDGANPEFGISARLLDLESLDIIAAASTGATGRDFARLFAVGRIDDGAELARLVVRRLCGELDQSRMACARSRTKRGGPPARVAVIGFDNQSDWTQAGEIVSGVLVSSLIQAGFTVVEPGVVDDILRGGGTARRGQVEFGQMERLVEGCQAARIVTGTVQQFRPESGEGTSARLEYGARVLDPQQARIVATVERSQSGGARGLFGTGETTSIIEVVRSSLRPLIKRIHELDK